MSLKAKLEAVIYAAEEPVTLGQLAALFSADALEWKAEREAASKTQSAEQNSTETETLQLRNAEFDYLAAETPVEGEGIEPGAETAPVEAGAAPAA